MPIKKSTKQSTRSMNAVTVLVLMTAPLSVSAQTYFGFGYGRSDHSKYTQSDREWDSVTITERDEEPDAFSLFVGGRVSENLSYELGYLNFGTNKLSGYVTTGGNTGYADTEIKLQGVGLSLLAEQKIGRLSPYLRFGLMYGQAEISSRINDPTPIFQNPNSSTTTKSVLKPLYGAGFAYRLTGNLSVRADYAIVRHAYSDYIDNINNGYIKRDVSLATISALYHFDERDQSSEVPSNKRLSIGLSAGTAHTSARMTSGAYAGNIWDLRTNTLRNTTVSGAMTDDDSDTTLRYSLYYDSDKYEYEVYIATLGEFKSRSAVNGVTGGGNALTGSVNRTVNAYGFGVGYKLKPTQRVTVIPRLGFAITRTRDEIFNNLDFTGVQGTERGPIVKSSKATPTVGITIGYQLSDAIELRGGIDYFDKTGTNRTLGEGSITVLTAGVKMRI